MSSEPPGMGREPEGPVAVRAFDKYFLVRKLAEGGMAEIFLAKQRGVDGFEKNVVIKRLLQHLSAQPDVIDMFRDEARLAAQLSHANVVQILELGFFEGCYFIAMEYLPGEDFSSLLRHSSKAKQYVPTGVVLKVISDAAAGLHYAHEFADPDGKPLGIVHRDISPSNLFVSFSGHVKVLDFGIARAESRLASTMAGTVKGKYQYMAPEQASSLPVDRRADVFALGVSLYEALTLRRAFARDNELAVLKAVLENDYVKPRVHRPDLSPELEAIVVRALAKDPAQRYQSASDLLHALEAYQRRSGETCSAEQLGGWAKKMVGPERVQERTRIPTLENFQHLPPLVTPPPRTPAPSAPTSPPTRVTSPESLSAPRPRSPVALLTGGIVAGVLLAVGLVKVLTPSPVVPAPLPPVASTGPVVAALPDAALPLAVAVVDAGSLGATVVDAGAAPVEVVVPRPVKPVRLEGPALMVTVKRAAPAMTHCIELNKAELSSDTGTIPLTVTIAGSGKVTRASTPLTGSKVGACLEERARAMRFPAHTDAEVTVTIPFRYEVKR